MQSFSSLTRFSGVAPISVRQLLLLLCGVSLASSAAGQCKTLDLKAPHWELVFGDEFNGPKLNDSLWVTTPGPLVPNKGKYAGWGSEYYPQPGDEDYDSRLLTFTPGDPDSTAVGVLHLAAIPLRMADSIDTGATYNKTSDPRYAKYKSAIIRSKVDYPAYGAYIMRARLPLAIDYQAWPTFWLWSCTTEIDILDGVGVNKRGRAAYLSNAIDNMDLKSIDIANDPCLSSPYAYPTLVDYTPGTEKNRAFNKKGKKRVVVAKDSSATKRSQFDTSYNTYAMVWTPEKVVFYFNEAAFMVVPRSAVRTLPKWTTIIASLQMFTRANMEKTYTMDIDYVRLYKTNSFKPDGVTPNYESIVCE